MGHYNVLKIGDETIWTWKNEFPSSKSALSLIFGPENKFQISEATEPDFKCGYKMRVGAAREKLDKLGFTEDEIESTISNLAGVEKDEVYLSILTSDEVYEEYGTDSDEAKIFERNKPDVKSTHLGNLDEALRLRRHLNSHEENEKVVLNLSDPVSAFRIDFEDEINTFTEKIDSKTKLEKRYLDFAKAHLSEGKYDLVHIEGIIALENKLNQFFESYPQSDKFNIPSTIDDLSFIKKIRFIFGFLYEGNIQENVIEETEKFYNTRSNIVHNNAKRFNPESVAKGLNAVEELINTLDDVISNLDSGDS